jgi:cytochrome P450
MQTTASVLPMGAGPPTPRRFSSLPTPFALPFVGSSLSVRLDAAHLQFERWARELGTPYRVRLGRRQMLVVDDAQAVASILKNRPGAFRRVRPLQSVFAEMGIAGVFSAEGADWERQRRLVMRAFDPSRLRGYFPSLLATTDRLRRRFSQAAAAGDVLDLQAEFMRYTVDVTAGLAFGVEINTIESGEDRIQAHLDQIFPAINRRMSAPFAYWRRLRLPADRRLDAHLVEVRRAIDDFIGQARGRMNTEPERRDNPGNLIEALLAGRDAPDSGLTDADVSGNIFTALLAGEDTTANTLAWLCHLLCDGPTTQAALRAEADAVVDQAGDSSDAGLALYTDAQVLPLLNGAVNEAMRLKPVAPLLTHETNEPLEVQGIALAVGTPVFTLLRAPGADRDVFVEPQRFVPERWLVDDKAWQAKAKKSLTPFGGGPRFCPGRYLALVEIKMVMTMLMRHFHLERVGSDEVTERFALSMMPAGLRVRLRSRAD